MIKTDSEFLQFALRHYDNPSMSSIEEFESDLSRFKYINNLLQRYCEDKNDLKIRLILNHIIIINNCFGVANSLEMFRYKILPKNKEALNTFLFFLSQVEKVETKLDFDLLAQLESI